MSKAQEIIKEILEFIKETEVYDGYKKQTKTNIEKINKEYQNRSFGYLEYEARLKTVLKDKSGEDWVHYYNAYLFSLIKKMDFLLAQLYSTVYEHKAELKTKKELPKKIIAKAEEKIEAEEKPALAQKKAAADELEEEIAALKQQIRAPVQVSVKKTYIAGPEVDTAFSERVKRFREKIKEREEHEIARIEEQKAKEELTRIEKQRAQELAKIKAPREKEELAKIEEQRTAMIEQKIKEKVIPKAALPEKKKIRLPIRIYSIRTVMQELVWGIKKLITAQKWISKQFTKIHLPAAHLPAIRILKKHEKPAEIEAPKEVLKFSLATQLKSVFSKMRPLDNLQKIKTTPLDFIKKLSPSIRPEKRRIFAEEIVGMEKAVKLEREEKEAGKILFGWPLGKKLISDILQRFKARQEPIMAPVTEIPIHVKKLRAMRERLYAEEHLGTFRATLLAEEAHRVKALLEKGEKPEVYKGSSIGLIANVSVKRLSLWLVDSFPEFFGYLYNALRAANIKILSNTYVNIMLLCTMGTFFISVGLMTMLFFILNYPLYQIIMRSAFFSFLGAGLCATTFYLYPFMKINERRKDIMTNLPFAINHVGSVAASGVPPASMFELISQSKEYGEVAVEIKKIVDFTQIFGYDLLTAIRSVASTTPSIEFKEFLEGMVSTIETGGDLESYLKQKAQEANLKYQLERQKYNETISTYSDIYTGLLIAAPLFFIAAMALINMLGGSLMGMSVDMVMALGAYLAVPVLNIAFLLFLQVSQPTV